MPKSPKWRMTGRASLAALGALALVVVGACLVLARRAQAATGKVRPTEFAPTRLYNYAYTGDTGPVGDNALLVDLFLPNVTGATQGFQLQVVTLYGTDTLTIPPSVRSLQEFWVFIETNQSTGAQQLVIEDVLDYMVQPAAITLPYDEYPVAVRVLPAVVNGSEVVPLSAGITVFGNAYYNGGPDTQAYEYAREPMH